MACQTEYEIVMPPILGGLVAVGPAVAFPESRGIDQSEAQGVVAGFVGAVFAVGEHGRAVSPALVGEVKPLVRRNLELFLIVIAALNSADIPVVGCLRVRGSQGECCF